MGISLEEGEDIPLGLLLDDRDASKFVQATVRDAIGDPIAGSPFPVPHKSDGYYSNPTAAQMTSTANIVVIYDVYDDSGFTVLSDHLPGSERFDLDVLGTIVSDLQDLIDQLPKIIGQTDVLIEVEPMETQIIVEESDVQPVIDIDDEVIIELEDDEVTQQIESDNIIIEVEG